MNKYGIVLLCVGILLGWSVASYTYGSRSVVSEPPGGAASVHGSDPGASISQTREDELPPVSHVAGLREPRLQDSVDGRTEVESDSTSQGIESVMKGLVKQDESIPTDEELEERFGDLTLPELKGAESAISWVLMRESKRLMKDKFDLGLYESAIVENGMGPMQKAPSDGSMRATSTRMVQLPSGQTEARTAELLPSDSPLMAARYAELRWLMNRAHELSKLEDLEDE
jgi:hypothetical protein